MFSQGHVPFPSNQNDMGTVLGEGGKAARGCGQRHQKNLSRPVNVGTSAG